MSNIISLSGKAEHGKDLTASILKEKLESKGYEVLIIHYADLVKYLAKQYFGWDGQKDQKGRTLLQWLGTDVVRKKKPNYWVDFVKGFVELFKDKYDYVLIPDCRFPNEVELWKQDGWDITALHIERLDYENHLTPDQRNHPSETALDNYKFDYYIKTVSGTEFLEKEVDKFIEFIGV
jgi:hypothetical protein